MKREASPIVVAVAILVLLVAIEVAYWQKLGPVKPRALGASEARGGRAPGGAAAAVPSGDPRFTVLTLAGAAEAGYRDGPADQARFDGPADVAMATDGTVFVADSRNHAIRSITPAGTVTTAAGGPGAHALSAPAGVEVLSDGSLLVADTGNHRICRVDGGRITVVAGGDTPKDELGRPSGGHKDGPAAQAQFRYPVGLAEGADGAVYVADAGNHCVRRIANGIVTTVSGGPMDTPTHVALGLCDNLRVTDTGAHAVWGGPASGPVTRLTSKRSSWSAPAGIAEAIALEGGEVSVGSSYLVADSGSHCLYLYRVGGDGAALVAGAQGTAGWSDGPGDQARFSRPAGVCASWSGTMYVADFGNNCIRTVALPGSSR